MILGLNKPAVQCWKSKTYSPKKMDRADTQSLSYLSKNKGHTWFYDASTSSSHQQHASTSGRGGQLLDFGRKQACNYVLGNSYKRITQMNARFMNAPYTGKNIAAYLQLQDGNYLQT